MLMLQQKESGKIPPISISMYSPKKFGSPLAPVPRMTLEVFRILSRCSDEKYLCNFEVLMGFLTARTITKVSVQPVLEFVNLPCMSSERFFHSRYTLSLCVDTDTQQRSKIGSI